MSSNKQSSTRKEFLASTSTVAGIFGICAGSLAQPAQAARSSKPKEIVVVGSKVKEVIRETGLRSDGELVQAVSDNVHLMLGAAIVRCKGNGRSTVRPYDL
jgi:hypothetical protein